MRHSENWQINQIFARRFLLGLLLTITMLLAFTAKYEMEGHAYSNMNLAPIFAVYIIAAIALKSCYIRFISKRVIIEFGKIIIPRFFWWDYRIDSREIAALEILGRRGSKRTALFIRRKRTPIAVSEDLFTCKAHFEEFINEVNKNISSVQNLKKENVYPRSFKTHITPTSIAIILVITFFIFSNYSDKLSDDALQVAGLTKNSFNFNDSYRLFSSFFLHYNIPHLTMNLIALGIFSHPNEIIVGRTRTINIIFMSALIGSIFSVILSPYDFVAGASGGISGLIGAYTVIHFRYSDKLVGSAFIPGKILFSAIAFQVMFDAFFDETDYISHFFGFISGAIYAGSLCRPNAPTQITMHRCIEQICALALCIGYLTSLAYTLLEYSGFVA